MRSNLTAGFALTLILACGEGDGDGDNGQNPPAPNDLCGAVKCPERARCDRSSADPICVCPIGYQGENCATCAEDHQLQSGVCVPLPINTSCEVGFQDYDGDLICRPACIGSGFHCFGEQICSDATGEAICTCPGVHVAGSECDQCARGYRELAAGPICVPTCELQPGLCNAQICSDLGREAACLCRPGFEPTRCSTCAAGSSSDGRGNCIAPEFPAPDPSLLLTSIQVANAERAIGTIDLRTREFTPLVWTSAQFKALAHAPPDRIYLLLRDELALLNLADGTTTTVAALESPGTTEYRAMIWDPASARVILLRKYSSSSAGGDELITVDPVTGAIETRALPFIEQPLALAFDASSQALIVLTESAIYRVSDQTIRLAEHPAPLIAPSGAAFLGDQFIYLQPALSPEAWLASKCRRVARMLAIDPREMNIDAHYETARIEGDTPTIHAFSAEPTGDPIEVTIDTRHPDAVVCLITDQRPLHIVVRATARFRHLYLAERENVSTLEIESAFPAPAENYRPLIIRSNNSALNTRPELTTLLDAAAAARMGLSSYSPGLESGGGTLLIVPTTGDAAGAQQSIALDLDYPMLGLSPIAP